MVYKYLYAFIVFFFFGLPNIGFSQDSSALPSADELIQNYLSANGGRANIEKLKSLVVKGLLVPSEEEGLTFQMYRKRPNMLRLRVNSGKTVITSFYDGVRGYRSVERPGGEVEVTELFGAELDMLVHDSSMEGPFFELITRPELIESIELDEVNGEPAYKLKLFESEYVRFDTVWLSQDHYQELKYRRLIPNDGSGPSIVEEVFFSDFEQLEGVYIAKKIKAYRDDALNSEVFIERARLNVGVFDSMFRPK